jgi:cation transport regulator ChaC
LTAQTQESVWVFGYGSLIWRPDIPHSQAEPARLQGWTRRFWQGSHDHRGLPDAPGRVVTLIEEVGAVCHGVAYLVERDIASALENLDHREKNGYLRHDVELGIGNGNIVGIAYIAPPDNHAFLGPAPLDQIAAQILDSTGPSGTNRDYLYCLGEALRRLDAHDTHVFELEALVRKRATNGHQLQR